LRLNRVPCRGINRMADILELAIRNLTSRHRHEQALGALDDPNLMYHETVIDGKRRIRLSFIIVTFGKQPYSYVRDFQNQFSPC